MAAQLEWHVEKRTVESLKLLDFNPRRISDREQKKLMASLEKFNLADIPVCNVDGTVISGNQRILCLRLLGRGRHEIDVRIPNRKLTKREVKEYTLTANTHSGEWDFDLLREHYVELGDLGEFGIVEVGVIAGLDTSGLEDKKDTKEDNYVIPDEVKTDIVIGDVITIGPHRLMCGDATKKDHLGLLMNGKVADLLLTDPPYGIGIDGQKESKAKNPKHNRKAHEFRGWDKSRPEKATFELILSFAGKAIIWGGNYFADILPVSRGWIYWSKGQDGLTMSDGELAWTSEDKPLRAITVNRGALQGSVHPTQKPVQVMSFCLSWAVDSDLILDTYLGSGSTMVACHQSGRICYGLEIDPKYCQVIINRMLALDPSLEIVIHKRN